MSITICYFNLFYGYAESLYTELMQILTNVVIKIDFLEK